MSFYYPTTIVNRSASTLSVSNATWTRISWDTVVNDDLSMSDLGSDATKLTMPSGYTKARFSAFVTWTSSSDGIRLMSLEMNDGGTEGDGTGIAALLKEAVNESGASLVTPWIYDLDSSDYFHLWVYQSSGSSLNLRGSGEAAFGGVSSLMVELAP